MRPGDRFDWLLDVLADTEVSIPGKVVAALLAAMVNEETGEAHPGREYIATHTGLSTGAVWNGLRSLESRGLLKRTSTRGRTCCAYRPTRHVVTGSTRQEVTGSEPTRHVVTPTRHLVNANPSPGDVEHGNEHGNERGTATSVAEGVSFAIRGGVDWQLPGDLRATLAAAFPAVDLDGELAKAAAWCATEPSRRKTAAGMGRFLRGWLGRAKPASVDAGLTFAERKVTAEEARAALGLPTGANP